MQVYTSRRSEQDESTGHTRWVGGTVLSLVVCLAICFALGCGDDGPNVRDDGPVDDVYGNGDAANGGDVGDVADAGDVDGPDDVDELGDVGDSSDGMEQTETGTDTDATDGGESCPTLDDVEPVACSEPAACPEADDSKSPEITCHEPRAAVEGQNVEVDLYGRYLLTESGGAQYVEARDKSDPAGTTRRTVGVEFLSDCHVRATLPVATAEWFACGNVAEVRLVRRLPSSQEGEVEASDWRDVRIVAGEGT